LDEGLLKLLDSDLGRSVFEDLVGFGSIAGSDSVKTTRTVLSAIRKANVRAVIGEYAGIAGGIHRPPCVFFSEVRTRSVIPVLIQCLAAPDHVEGSELSCVAGPPGSSTGRNTHRPGIPLALAQLQATEAIPALQSIVRSHHDPYLRKNAPLAADVPRPLADDQATKKEDANTEMQEIGPDSIRSQDRWESLWTGSWKKANCENKQKDDETRS
jgi:hypothetical protein